MRGAALLQPAPVVRAPPPRVAVAASVNELEERGVGDVVTLDRESIDARRAAGELVVPAEGNLVAVDAERRLAVRDGNPLLPRRPLAGLRRIPGRLALAIEREPVPHVEERFLV